ncbi:MAG TPA: bifunctional oligoribonuclease/PAP phosphatase NrnA [Candidatus Caccovicinus merdipullorum]|uniref:Bifunctional oligoribonuclease/PAP phosphatase NrnA n=1 Tax=Candidatus Caccovicinus merdipullorum TaxID=2840724 RepID=A0A9D1GIV9_9FIRM|nr:bifunctional oligoribonuclease/PAP phosphatase NrnA [Candidatus Caccovicinus merdipullorum]
MTILDKKLEGTGTVLILGHVRPDGDCVGSCLGLLNYLENAYPQTKATVCLEAPAGKFGYMKGFDQIQTIFPQDTSYDLCICLDCSDKERLGAGAAAFQLAKDTLCIDHHITNRNYCAENVVEPNASSTCEVLFGLMDEAKITKETAACLYTGIVHDTGVFRYSCTSSKTMNIAGKLMDKGIDFSSIIDDSFFRKTYVQNQILGRALLESITFLHGKCIFSVVRLKDMDFYGVTSKDLDGIVEQLRVTEGIHCALFLYEVEPQIFKVSMRSNTALDVAKIAGYFGGGGHVKAAGCTMSGSIYDVVNNLSGHIEKQILELEAKEEEKEG